MKKTLPMRLLAIVICVAMLATVTPIFASAESATYLDYNMTTGKTDVERTATGVNVIDEATDAFVTGWNIVKGDVEIETRITLPKNVYLILANGATLTADRGIVVAEDGNFLIYAQSNDADTMGKLIVPVADYGYAGIGSAESSGCGDIVIFGGDITATGGELAAGIGSGNMGDCGTITIYGGIVTATNGENGAGIGGGLMSDCGDIVIYGGTVTATSNQNAAAIGSGYYSNSCGVIAIGGGIVTAESKNYGAGIGGGSESPCNGVMITGGYVKATAARNAEPIGKGDDSYGEDDTPAVLVSIASSCTSVIVDKTRYINYKILAREPNCTESGFAAHYIDPYTGNYYEALPFTEETLIGDETALAAWKAEDGDGYTGAALGHDWQNAAGGIHRCARCDLAEVHADADENEICDTCEAALSSYTLYLDYNETTGAVDVERKVWNANVIDEATDAFVTGWNIVKGDVEFMKRIELPKDVNLILANGATLTAKQGITVAPDGDFAVYAQSNDKDTMGKLIATSTSTFSAGIGAFDNDGCGNIAIYGGDVTATSGNVGAGIGGSTETPCGDIAIYGGIVTAQGGEYGAGIGGSRSVRCGTILISGGDITAQGGFDGAGIGGGLDGSCSQVMITGGIVTAQGGDYGAGIGTGFEGTCNKLTIAGGYVKATAGYFAESIGAGHGGTVIKTSIDDACTSLFKYDAQFINYEPFAKVEPTCTSVGAAAYVKDYVSGNYYTAFPFTEDGLIGDGTALAAWKEQGGAGFLEKLPHRDLNRDTKCDGCGAVHATYLDYNETTGQVDTACELWGVHVVENEAIGFESGWNIVYGNVTFDERITLPKNVNLILANGATMTAKKGITVADDGDFAVYAQSNDAATMGKLIVPDAAMDAASIGTGGVECHCGDITIYGGVVTAINRNGGVGIGSGHFYSSCGDITIFGGIVTATGDLFAAGIGSGYDHSSCGNITISGGYVKATAGSDASPIGAGHEAGCGSVSIASSCTSVRDGATQYINYLISALDPTCTEAGFAAHYIDPTSGLYYTAISLEADKRIGDAEALAAWKAQGGGGYVAPLGHDWQFVDEDTHKCTRCEITTAHVDTDADYYCDDCSHVLLATAIAVTKAQGEAKAALKEAVGENPSDELATILNDACAAVDAATTLDGVASAKEQGLSGVAAQKATELEARRAEYLPRCESILESDDYSDKVKAMTQEFVRALNASETLKEIDYAVETFAPAIQLRMARDHWTVELRALSPEEPSTTVTAIIEDACELIENDEDMWAFSYVYDITRLAVERQLTTEANTKAMDALLKQAAEDLATANESIDELNNIVKSKEATIAEKQAALDTATDQLNAAKADLETAKAALEAAQAKVTELEGTVSEKDEALAQAAKDLEDAQQTLAQNEQEIKDLQAEIERLKALLDDDPTTPTDPTDPTDPQPEKLLGDANGDGAVNMKDVLLMRKYLADNADAMNMENADCNADGDVNMKDVLMLRKYLANIIDTLGA